MKRVIGLASLTYDGAPGGVEKSMKDMGVAGKSRLSKAARELSVTQPSQAKLSPL